MASPVIEDGGPKHSGNALLSNPIVVFPAGVADGDQILSIIVSGGGAASDGRTSTWPVGWTKLFDINNDVPSVSMHVGWRDADGSTDGTSVTVTLSSGNVKWVALCYRISGASGVPDYATDGSPGTTKYPDPPSVTMAGGSGDYLGIAACGWNSHGANYFVTAPSGYGNGADDITSNSTFCQLMRADKSITSASTENPGTFEAYYSDGDYLPVTIIVGNNSGGGSGKLIGSIAGLGGMAGRGGGIAG